VQNRLEIPNRPCRNVCLVAILESCEESIITPFFFQSGVIFDALIARKVGLGHNLAKSIMRGRIGTRLR
jgi:hypothetical protein